MKINISHGKTRKEVENEMISNGFRKSALHVYDNDYHELSSSDTHGHSHFELAPFASVVELASERNLHMDMTRESGSRSDAHLYRYRWAAERFTVAGDVLDAACGYGYGASIISFLHPQLRYIGIDASEMSIEYARNSFPGEFSVGFLPDCLQAFRKCSSIVSFETLEHISDPAGALEAFHSALRIGGQLFVSVPNDWSDETGEDPNPDHLHVYTLERLVSEVEGAGFTVVCIYGQNADRAKVNGEWEARDREIFPISGGEPCEWLLLEAIK